MFNEADTELRDLLSRATNEELDPLLECILGKDRKGRISSALDMNPLYKEYPKEPTRYWKAIGEEIQCYGGNAIANASRGYGVPYHEILVDVAKKLKVNFNKNSPSERIELALFSKVLEDAWEKLSREEREKVVRDLGDPRLNASLSGPAAVMAIQAIMRAGGFATYQIAVIVVNAIWRVLFGHGLKFAVNAGLTRWIGVFLGPIGWIVTGGWLAIDLLGPAYRVTIPAVFQIALIRQSQKARGLNA